MTSRRTIGSAICVVAVLLTACGSEDQAEPVAAGPGQTEAPDSTDTAPSTGQAFPDIVDATATESDGAWRFDVTVSSPYDSPERYADGWRVVGPDGTEYGFRLLTHDHASEQPFTRSLFDVEIPDDVDVVTIEGRDQVNGFGGDTFELTLPRR